LGAARPVIVAKRAATPGAANDVLKKFKILLHSAIDMTQRQGWRRAAQGSVQFFSHFDFG
jgi:hypothetical protein